MILRKRVLLLITAGYFTLPFIHIYAALTALLCMMLPFILLSALKRNVWCSRYCPRSHWLSFSGLAGRGVKTPGWLVSKKMRSNVLSYFCINLLFVALSTVMVASGRMAPMDYVRLFIIIPTGVQLPQLIDAWPLHPVLLHLSYRLYSVMLSSALAGTLLSLLYKPRTWCTVCPVNTLSSTLKGESKISHIS